MDRTVPAGKERCQAPALGQRLVLHIIFHIIFAERAARRLGKLRSEGGLRAELAQASP